MNCIGKYFKKRRLLKKYEFTDQKALNDIHLIRLMKHDLELIEFITHQRACERRCYERLKKL